MPVGRGVDARGGALLAVPLLKQAAEEPERHGRLGRRAGLRDHVHGEVHAVEQLHRLAQLVGGETVADEIDVGGILLFQVVVRRAQALDHAARAEIRPADADDDERLRVAPDLLRRLLNARELRAVIALRQVHPARELTADAVALLQMAMDDVQPRGQLHLIWHGDKLLQLRQINLNHMYTSCYPLLFLWDHFTAPRGKKQPQFLTRPKTRTAAAA